MSKRNNDFKSGGSSKGAKKPRSDGSAAPSAASNSNGAPAQAGKKQRTPRVRVKDRDFIDLPKLQEGQEETVLPEDMEVDEGADWASAAAFLAGVDAKQMSRSRRSIKEEWKKNKPVPEKQVSRTTLASQQLAAREKEERKQASGETAPAEGDDDEDMASDDLAFGSGDSDDDLSIMSDASLSDDEDLGSEDFDSEDFDSEDDDDLDGHPDEDSDDAGQDSDEAAERAYATFRRRQDAQDQAAEAKASAGKQKLPTKLPDGSVKYIDDEEEARHAPEASTSKKQVKLPALASDEDSENEEGRQKAQEQARPQDPLGPRFGRAGIKNLLQLSSKSQRVSLAKAELATLSGDIMADPENSLNLLKRLLAFCDRKFSMGKKSAEPPLPVDQPIRALALLSMLAVYLDILPAYRIRERTEKEKQSRISQDVARQHEWEAGLVGTYKRFLEICERDVKDSTPLMPVALKALCDLLKEKTQFNFATNIMDVVAKHIGRPDWDPSSAACLDAIVHVFQNDSTGSESLSLVRMMSKTIKSRSFRVHPAVLSSLLHLKFGELNVRAGTDSVIRDQQQPLQPKSKLKDKKQPQQHLSKKARRAMKLKKEVEKEYAEAEMSVTAEERERDRTETLKNVFALYFRIVKLDHTSALLGPALEGLARFSHLINVDFFRDLLENLKALIQRSGEAAEDSKSIKPLNTRQQLLCVVTAFELLTGQGEALNIDLGDFVTALYTILIPLSFSPSFEESPPEHIAELQSLSKLRSSEAHLLFKALDAIFVRARQRPPPGRCLAFSKRLLMCALHWPADSALRSIQIVQNIMAKQSALEGMLTTEDMRMDGVYKPEANDPGLANAEATAWYELHLLEKEHYDDRVRTQASALLNWTVGS